jgi:hypothetical protein
VIRLAATAVVLAWVCALLAASSPVLAQRPSAASSTRPSLVATSMPDGITLHVPPVIKAGREIAAEATLVSGGLVQPEVGLHFLIDDIERRIVKTDSQGTAYFRLRGVLASGMHMLQVRYQGSRYSGSAAAATAFDVAPLIITVQTVPAVPGITVGLDNGRALHSDASGQVLLAVARAGVHALAVSLPAPTQNTRISFMRWSDDSWAPSRPIRVVKDISISLGLRLAYLTPIQFVDLDFNPLDPTRVNGVVISGPNAEVIQPQYPYDALWLQTPLPAKHSGESGLHITAAPYSLSFAKYDRLNVASVGQMRFTPELNGTWKIKLLLYTLRLGAKDALFGTTLDNPIRLTGPTGRIQTVMLDRDGHNTLVLGRGNYSAQVLAPGLTPIATIALSRSQDVLVPVVTPIDFFVLAVILLVFGTSVFVAGRGRLWAFGRLAAARVQVGEPILQGFNQKWERRSSQRAAIQSATAAAVDRLRPRQVPSVQARLDISQMVSAYGSHEEGSLTVLDSAGTLGTRPVTGIAPTQLPSLPDRASVLPRGYMLVDEGGLSQAMQVGLIIGDLLSANTAERFLLLVHQSVMRQWQHELMDKLGVMIPRFERGTLLDHDDRELEWSGNPWRAFPLVLASSQLGRRRDRRNELLASGPWDVVVVDDAHEAHRSGSKAAGTPNKLLALLQAMKLSGSWKTLFLASTSPSRIQLNQALDLMDLLGVTNVNLDLADELASHFAIPTAEERDDDWKFLARLCLRFFTDSGSERQTKKTPRRRPAADRVVSNTIEAAAVEAANREPVGRA